MNCVEFESLVVEMAREGRGDGHLEGLEHATTCERCARRLAHERLLNAVVAAVTEQDEERRAPAVVEKMLVAAFREGQSAHRKRRLAWFRRAIAAGIAASLVLAAYLALRQPEHRQAAQVKSTAPAPAVQPAKIIAPVYREVQKPPARILRAAQAEKVRPLKIQPATVEREVVTDFIPLVYDSEPVDRGRVVRVRLPRAALAAFGLPVNEQLADEPIQADVVLGEDGLARAVRFVE